MTDPVGFARAFAAAWGAQDIAALRGLITPDAGMLTLTGHWCEGAEAIAAALDAEFAGLCAHARLVTGKARLRPLGDGHALLEQRFVLAGLVNASGADAGRVSAMLVAVLVQGASGWQAASVQFTALAA